MISQTIHPSLTKSILIYVIFFKKNLIKGYDSFLMSPSVMSTRPLMGCLVSLSVQSSLHLFTRAAQQYWQQYPLRGRRIRGAKCIRGK